ncbi:MAG: hypothetical protein OES14_05485 [Nitrosopumilus sp.]|nr:hypothetical protein [Nitrosopumilus sp.]MDH3825226.1 hypothetical protein [Nitrosopumilus sp.]
MVYSNAWYFASHFDKLTQDVFSTFNEKQKSQKNTKQDKINLAKNESKNNQFNFS